MCIRAFLQKNFLTFSFFLSSVSQRHFVAVALCKLSIALQPFFLLNLNSTNNKWHLNSPQGSAYCQREMQQRAERNQRALTCVSEADCVCVTRQNSHVCLRVCESTQVMHVRTLVNLYMGLRPSNFNTFLYIF